MKQIKVFMKSRKNGYFAEGFYDGKVLKVMPGGKVSSGFSEKIRGGTIAKNKRADRNVVTTNGEIINECVFNSPSTAAQFVSGQSRNGYLTWKTEDGEMLKNYLVKKGLR